MTESLLHAPALASHARYVRGCRCVDCKAAHATYQREWAARNPEKLALRRSATCPECGGRMTAGNGPGRDPERCVTCLRASIVPPHGTLSRYSGKAACRCDDCRAANTTYYRERRKLKRAAA